MEAKIGVATNERPIEPERLKANQTYDVSQNAVFKARSSIVEVSNGCKQHA